MVDKQTRPRGLPPTKAMPVRINAWPETIAETFLTVPPDYDRESLKAAKRPAQHQS